MTGAAWYAARGTGVVTLVLLTVVMVLGVGSRSGRPAFGLPRFAVSIVHRNASLIAVTLLAVHVAALLIDPYAQIRLVDVVVPFAAPYRTMWVGFGTIALDLIVALVATSLLRTRMAPRAWRAVHWLAYAAWPVAWMHGIGTGTDRGTGWYLATAALTAVAVIAALAWRLSPGFVTLGGRRLKRIPDLTVERPTETTTYRGGRR
jgi:methionine sulfoxide reductase heme-binding subunit